MNIQDSKVEPDAAINIKIMNSDTNSDNSVPHSLVLASFVCLLASAFYFYEFILQVSPSVMTHQLMKAYSVGAAGLGTISAFYFYAYAPMQLPAGMLYDRFGPRTLLPITVLICAIGTLLFSMTHSAFLAAHGRFLIGLGSAFSFTGTLILISRWFPPQYFALLAGITQSMSSAGAIFGQAPLAHAITHYGWRQSLVGLSVAGFILALFMWLFIRDYPRGQRISRAERRASTDTKGGLRFVLHNKQSWYIAIYGFTIWASIVTFAGLWGVPYVKAVYHISTAGASVAVSMVWIGIGIGSPLSGWVSDRIGLRRTPLILFAFIGIISTIMILYLPGIPYLVMCVALLGLGVAASGQSLSFAVIKDNTPSKFVGTAVGFNNMAIVAGGAIFQPLVGYFLHHYWTGGTLSGVHIFSASAFQRSLWILPLCYLVAFVVSLFFIKETHCKSVNS